MPKTDTKRPTLKTIAAMTGLSISTVSLSLRDGRYVKHETREKVAKAAQKVGYVPDRAGVRLRTGRTNVLALVLSTDKNAVDFTHQILQGLGAELHDTPYHLNVVPEFDRGDPLSAVRFILDSRGADGVILTHTSALDPRVALLNDAGFPFVSHGRTAFETAHAFHDFDTQRFVEMAVDRLVSKGRTNLLLAAADNDTTNYANTVAGFRQSVAKHGVSGTIISSLAMIGNPEGALVFGHSLAETSPRYDAIIANNELSAAAIICGLREKGVELGVDYDLICKQTSVILPTMFPKLDTIGEDLFATGKALASLLIRRINGENASRLRILEAPVPHWRSLD